MNHSLLREWLSLPPGPWPPADRELLGLPESGEIDANTVELKALERMDILRPRQLVDPELVTEGMNRLAQSLIALTSTSPLAPDDADGLTTVGELFDDETNPGRKRPFSMRLISSSSAVHWSRAGRCGRWAGC